MTLRIPNLKKKRYTNDISPLLYKLLKTDNIHNVIIDNINLNDNLEIFESLIQKKKVQKLYQKFKKNDVFEKNKENENEDTQNNKFKDFNNDLLSLYRLHSSKFHSRKIEKEKSINDKFNEEMNFLVNRYEKNNDKIYLGKDIALNKIKNFRNINQYRKKLAFRFRYMNYSPKKINLKKNFKIKDDKMNKILKISKSIPNFLLKKTPTNKNKKINNFFERENNEDSQLNKHININDYTNRREFGFISPFKFNRYVGNIYNYYRSNHSLNENYLIFNDKINEDVNKSDNEKMIELKIKNQNSYNLKPYTYRNNNKDINRRKIIKLNYLLSKE